MKSVVHRQRKWSGKTKRRRKGGKRMANGFICGEGGGHMDAVEG